MSVFGLLSATAGFVKVRYLVDKEIIDNAVFRCHYRVTSAILFVCCILCTANSLIGDPIQCISDAFKDKIHVINTYCWITSTFTLPQEQNKPVGTYVAGPGLGTHIPGAPTLHHNYYQWVPFVLFLQGVMFYFPHWMWKNWEDGKIKKVSEGMRGSTADSKQSRETQHNRLVQYIVASLNVHDGYAMGYFICECLNFINVVGNIFFIDKFLGNAFLKYGTKVLEFANNDQVNRTDPMIAVFPRLTKCTFRKYGPSGGIEAHDSLCVLPLNILNEKIFIFLWFWFIILAILSGLSLIYSIVLALHPPARKSILKRRFKFRPPHGLSTIVNKLKVGDFLLLHLLGQNMCSTVFQELLEDLSSKLNTYNSFSSAQSTLEMTPIYPQIEKLSKDTDA